MVTAVMPESRLQDGSPQTNVMVGLHPASTERMNMFHIIGYLLNISLLALLLMAC